MPEIQVHNKSFCWTAVALAAVCLLGAACSGGETGPRQGTPEWFWEAANDNYAIPDYTKTVEQLKETMKAEGDLAAKAGLWRCVLTGGLALGYDQLADAFVKGTEANEGRTEDFQPSINEYRRRTRINAIQFAEGLGALEKLLEGQETVTLDVPLPEGDGTASTVLSTVEAGNKVDAELVAMEDTTLARGVFALLSTLSGGKEFPKLIEEAGAGGIQASSDEIGFGVARTLLDISVMFDREGLNDPKVRAHVLNMSQTWVEPHLENEEFAEAVEEFEFDMENERRDIDGKRRIKKDE